MTYVITDEYMAQKRKIRMEHKDVSHLEHLKADLDRLQGWIEEILEDEDAHYQGWDKSDLDSFTETLKEFKRETDKKATELYKQYGLKYEEWKGYGNGR